MPLTHADVHRILDVLDHAANLNSVEVRVGEFFLSASKSGSVRTPTAHQVGPQVPAASSRTGNEQAERTSEVSKPTFPEGVTVVRSPMVGTFYRRPKPDESPFVEEGMLVEAGASLALLEAMKLFNTISAPVSGRLVRILADDKQLVEKDAPLMLIEPERKE